MIEGGSEQARVAPRADQRAADVAAEVVAVGGGEVGQVRALPVVPELLGGVEVRRVGGSYSTMTRGASAGREAGHRCAAAR